MKNLVSILLLGVLSMLFAEVFSGASTLWFFSLFGLLLTLPLYLSHSLFFYNVAMRTGRTTLRQLYFFGMMFGLYEALITKVLWFGYPNAATSTVGYFYGIAWGEFLTLVLFWHPVMSFIVPVLVYEILSKDILPGHDRLLQKNRATLSLVSLLIITGAIFQNNGSNYNLLVALGSILGTILLIFLLHRLSPHKTLHSLVLGRNGMIILVLYIIALYATATVFILPQRLPRTFLPYFLIFLWYLLAILLLWADRFKRDHAVRKNPVFSVIDLGIYTLFLLGAAVLLSLFPSITYAIILVFFLGLMAAGVLLFSGNLFFLAKALFSQKR